MNIARVGVVALCALWTSFAGAQTWPTKPVKIIVPFTAGSATDILARTFGQKLSEYWGQPVVVENHPGAGGTIGTGIVANAPGDGYTLLVHSAAYAVNPFMYPNLPFDTLRDLMPVMLVGKGGMALVTHPDQPYKSFRDVVAAAHHEVQRRVVRDLPI